MIAYQYIGEAALAGLLGLVFGMKGENKGRIEDAQEERDEHEQLMEQAETAATKHHDEAQAIANDITEPKEPVKAGKVRKRFSTREL